MILFRLAQSGKTLRNASVKGFRFLSEVGSSSSIFRPRKSALICVKVCSAYSKLTRKKSNQKQNQENLQQNQTPKLWKNKRS